VAVRAKLKFLRFIAPLAASYKPFSAMVCPKL